MSEITYQNLKKLLPPTKEDTRSVHFLLFPESKKEYFDDDIERMVGRMQSVIELGRVIRDQKTIALKTPCKELIIINSDPQYHEDIKALENYIKEVFIRLMPGNECSNCAGNFRGRSLWCQL